MNTASRSNITASSQASSSRCRVAMIGACMLFCASVCLQLSLSGVPVEAVVVSVVLGVIGGFAVGFFQGSPLGSRRVFMVLLGSLAVSFILSVKGVMAAWASVVNRIIVAWDATSDGYVLPLRIPDGLSIMDIAAMGICFAATVGLILWAILRSRKSLLAMGTSILFVLVAVFCGTATYVSLGFILASGMLLSSMLVMMRGASFDPGVPCAGHTSLGGVSSIIPPICAVLVAAICLGSWIAASAGDRPQAAALRADVLQTLDDMRFGSDTLPEGAFSKAHRMNRVEDDPVSRLEVSFESPDALEQSYFRGFIGADYEGVAFDQVSLSAYDGQWLGLFEWLEHEGLDPATQSAQYAKLDDQAFGIQSAESEMLIEAKQANRKYSYSPYQTLVDDQVRPLLDIYLQPSGFFGLGDERILVIEGSQANEYFTPSSWVSASTDEIGGNEGAFLQAERAYRAFAYDTYLDVRDGTDDVIHDFFFSGEGWDPSTKDLYSIATRIRSMLESHCSFTFEPAAFQASSGSDYVEWFLNTEKQGNSSAFAAAAVLAFREAGVPARYVEGYLLSQANVDALRDAGQTNMQLTSREAHAWAEVYIDGVGWTPMEMTPGFYDKSYSAEQTIEISKEVAGDGSDSDLSGSLDRSWDDWIPEELRPFAWVGLVLLVAIIAFMLFGVLELQRYARIRRRRRRLDSAIERVSDIRPAGLTVVGCTRVSAVLFDRMEKALRYAPVSFDATRPDEYADDIGSWAHGLDAAEYLRAIELIERERFGAIELNSHEIHLIGTVVREIEAEVWRVSPWWRKPILRYVYLFDLPL